MSSKEPGRNPGREGENLPPGQDGELPPGRAKKEGGEHPPGHAKEEGGELPPGKAKKDGSELPPGQAKKGGYSTFPPGQAKDKGRFRRFKDKTKQKMGLYFLPEKYNPPATVAFMKKLFPSLMTPKKVKWFTVVYLAVVYIAYHMSRLPFSIAKTVLHPNCSAMDAALAVSNVKAKDECGWAPFDKPNYALLFGVLDYAFTFTYSVGLVLISGPLAERLRPRFYLAIGIFLSGCSTALFGLGYHLQIHSLWYYVLCMILLGVFQSTGLPTIVAVLTEWTSKEARGKTIGIWSTSMFIGNIMGALVPGHLVTKNWATSFYVPGLCMIVLSFITPFLVLSAPKEVGFTRDGKEIPLRKKQKMKSAVSLESESSFDETSKSEKSALISAEQEKEAEEEITSELDDTRAAVTCLEAIKVPGVLEFAASLFFVKLVSYTALYWLPKMMNMKGFSPKDASQLTAIFDAGGMFGSLFAGLLSDKLDYAAMIVTFALTAGMPPLLGLNYLDGYPSTPYYMVLLLLSGVLVNGPYAYIVSVVSSKKGEHHQLHKNGEKKGTATISGIIDGIGSFGGALGPLIAGYVAGINYDYIVHLFIVALLISILTLSRQVILEFIGVFRGKRDTSNENVS